jgi:predicted SprT family Zn-dependent metalloprotease
MNDNLKSLMTPTLTTYNEWQAAYDYFNEELFSGKLPECLITLNRSRRAMGYFFADTFENPSGKTKDELSMNPKYITNIDIVEAFSTFVHEMCHVWQHHFGTKKSRGRYHNREWGTEMKRVGLMPSKTGKPGGAQTGQQMLDYVIDGGMFEIVCKRLLAKEFHISWTDVRAVCLDKDVIEVNDKAPRRRRYSCRACRVEVWGQPELLISCETCKSRFDMQK